MSEDGMKDHVEASRATMQQLTRDGQESSLRNMKNYLASRQTTLDTFSRLDPVSRETREARELLDKARRDYEEYARSIRVDPEGTQSSP